MPAPFDHPPASGTVRRSKATDLAMAGAAPGLALACAFAAQMGVPQAQPLVGAMLTSFLALANVMTATIAGFLC